MSLESSGSYQDLSASTLGFFNKRNFEASRALIETRSENQKPFGKQKQISSIWDLQPVDFSVKLYHPKPPKRNSRDAIKPWTYDKYLRPIQTQDNEQPEKISADKSIVESYLNENYDFNRQESEADFQKSFRALTPNGARVEASKLMGFRDGLEQFKNPKPHDFRGLKTLIGMSEFRTRFEKDPFKIKFLSNSLNQVHGLAGTLTLRDTDPGLQLGDKVKKAEPHYDPQLVLPRLSFPNKFNGYTRHRRKDRSVESAFWDRVLPRLSDRLNDTRFKRSIDNLDSE